MKVIKIQPSEQKKSNLNKSESNKKQFKYNQVKIEPKTYALISLEKKKKKKKTSNYACKNTNLKEINLVEVNIDFWRHLSKNGILTSSSMSNLGPAIFPQINHTIII